MRFRLLLLTVVLFALRASPLRACTCAEFGGNTREKVEREYRDASVIFEGKVESIETRFMEDALGAFDRRVVTLRILRVYKGPNGKTVILRTGTSEADCGVDFQAGKTYLVYAYQDAAGQLSTNICTRTRRLWRATADRRYLTELIEKERKEKKR
jgi:ferredoxin-fold anticodon binding domain-containing protein